MSSFKVLSLSRFRRPVLFVRGFRVQPSGRCVASARIGGQSRSMPKTLLALLTAPWNSALSDDQKRACCEPTNPILDHFVIGHCPVAIANGDDKLQQLLSFTSTKRGGKLSSRAVGIGLLIPRAYSMAAKAWWRWRPSSARYPRLMQACLLSQLLPSYPFVLAA